MPKSPKYRYDDNLIENMLLDNKTMVEISKELNIPYGTLQRHISSHGLSQKRNRQHKLHDEKLSFMISIGYHKMSKIELRYCLMHPDI